MIELERHIEILLLSNDCVIVPDFGGFVAHHVDARYDSADGSFIPPIRTLGFNPQLKMNDSLLIHSYIEAYGLSYPEALQRVEQEVSELRNVLGEQGFYELNNIGTLTQNTDGNLEFTPNEAGILTPCYYGLSAFPMPMLAQRDEVQQTVATVQPAATTATTAEQPGQSTQEGQSVLAIDESADDDSRTISIRVAWIRNAVAVAAAVLAFFLLTTPVANSVVTPQMTLSSFKPSLPANTVAPDSTLPVRKAATDSLPAGTSAAKPDAVPTDADTQATTVRREAQPGATATSQVKVQPQPEQQSYYAVVLASQVSMSNAENYVRTLHRNGYKEARVHTQRKINRVIYGRYLKESDAYKAVNRLRDNEEFDEAWVMKVKSE